MSQHSTVTKNLPTKLDLIANRSVIDPKCVFNNLGHVLDLNLLRNCFNDLDGSKAKGVDGITKEDYRENLQANLENLLGSIRNGSYHPKPSRIVEIPKPDGSTRPLAIACFEDKIIQEAVRRIVEAIYEPHFLACSFGFRPNKNPHQALATLTVHLNKETETNAVLDIDLRKYFNTIPHAPLVEFLKYRISDARFLKLMSKLLKAPSLVGDKIVHNEIGSPQGSILSPLLANIYLHFVLDLWFRKFSKKLTGGKAHLVRYADDVVFTFPDLKTAELFKGGIVERLAQFGLSINESKTKLIPFGKKAAKEAEAKRLKKQTFTFLGFTVYIGKSTNRTTKKQFYRIKLQTDGKRMRTKIQAIKEFIRANRHDPELLAKVRQRVIGYLNYFAVTDNSRKISGFMFQVTRSLFKWFNRRSQKRSFTWKRFNEFLAKNKFPKSHVRVNIIELVKYTQSCW